jgi:hypothetical protein
METGAPREAEATGEGGIADATPPSTLTWVRLANWSPDAPAVDFCLAPHGTGAFRGPLAASLATALDAGATALAFPLVSAYLELAPDTYDARVVVAGAGNCTVGIGADTTTLAPLAAGAFSTIAVVGEELPRASDPGLQVVGFSDSTLSGTAVSLRFINASPGLTTVDFGTGTITPSGGGAAFRALFSGVLFGQAGKAALPSPDAGASPDGGAFDAAAAPIANASYATLTKLSNVLSAHDPRAGADAVVTMAPVSAAPGSVLTFVLVGGTSADTPPKPKLLECVDNAGTVDELSNCCGIDFSTGSAIQSCPE